MASKSFNLKQDAETAVDILSKNREVLERNTRHSLVDIALKNTAFKQAVEAEAKKIGAGRLMKEINASPNRVMSIAGASQVRSEMKSSLNKLAQDFKKLGINLSSAKNKLQFKKTSGQNINLFDTSDSPFILTTASYQIFTPEPKRIGEMNYYPVEMIRIGYGRSNETSESRAAAVEPITITGALIIAVVLIIGAWGLLKCKIFRSRKYLRELILTTIPGRILKSVQMKLKRDLIDVCDRNKVISGEKLDAGQLTL